MAESPAAPKPPLQPRSSQRGRSPRNQLLQQALEARVRAHDSAASPGQRQARSSRPSPARRRARDLNPAFQATLESLSEVPAAEKVAELETLLDETKLSLQDVLEELLVAEGELARSEQDRVLLATRLEATGALVTPTGDVLPAMPTASGSTPTAAAHEQQLDQVVALLDQLEADKTAMTRDLDEFQRDVAALKQERDALQARMKQQGADADAGWTEELAKLQGEHKQELDRHEALVAQLGERVEQLQMDKSAAEQMAADAEARAVAAETKAADLEAEVAAGKEAQQLVVSLDADLRTAESSLSSVQDDLAATQRRCDRHQARARDLEAELEQALRSGASLDAAKHEALETRVRDTTEQARVLAGQLAQAEAEVRASAGQIAERDERLATLTRSILELRALHNDKDSDEDGGAPDAASSAPVPHHTLLRRIASQKELVASSTHELRQLRTRVEESEAARQRIKDAMQLQQFQSEAAAREADAQIQQLRQEVQRLQGMADASNNAMSRQAAEQVAQLRQEIASQDRAAADAADRIASLEVENDRLLQDVADAEQQLEQAQHDAQQERKAVSDKHADELAAAAAEAAQAAAQVELVQQDNAKLQEVCDRLGERNAELAAGDSALRAAQQERDDLRQALSSKDADLTQLRDQLASVNAELAELVARNNSVQEERDELLAMLEEMRAEASALQDTCDELRRAVEVIPALKNRATELEDELAHALADLDDAKDEVTSLQRDRTRAATAAERAAERITKLDAQVSTATSELASLRADASHAESEVERLTDELEEAAREMASLRAAASRRDRDVSRLEQEVDRLQQQQQNKHEDDDGDDDDDDVDDADAGDGDQAKSRTVDDDDASDARRSSTDSDMAVLRSHVSHRSLISAGATAHLLPSVSALLPVLPVSPGGESPRSDISGTGMMQLREEVARLRPLAQERDALYQQLDALSASVDELTHRLSDAETQRDALVQQRDVAEQRLETERAAAADTVAKLRMEVAAAASETDVLQQRLAHESRMVQQLQVDYTSLVQTRTKDRKKVYTEAIAQMQRQLDAARTEAYSARDAEASLRRQLALAHSTAGLASSPVTAVASAASASASSDDSHRRQDDARHAADSDGEGGSEGDSDDGDQSGRSSDMPGRRSGASTRRISMVSQSDDEADRRRGRIAHSMTGSASQNNRFTLQRSNSLRLRLADAGSRLRRSVSATRLKRTGSTSSLKKNNRPVSMGSGTSVVPRITLTPTQSSATLTPHNTGTGFVRSAPSSPRPSDLAERRAGKVHEFAEAAGSFSDSDGGSDDSARDARRRRGYSSLYEDPIEMTTASAAPAAVVPPLRLAEMRRETSGTAVVRETDPSDVGSVAGSVANDSVANDSVANDSVANDSVDEESDAGLRARLEDLERTYAASQQALAVQRKQIQALELEKTSLEDEQAQAEGDAVTLAMARDDALARCRGLEADLAAATQHARDLEQEVMELTAELDSRDFHDSKIAAADPEAVAALQTRVSELSGELQRTRADAERRLAEARSEHSQDIDVLNEQVRAASQRPATRDAATMPLPVATVHAGVQAAMPRRSSQGDARAAADAARVAELTTDLALAERTAEQRELEVAELRQRLAGLPPLQQRVERLVTENAFLHDDQVKLRRELDETRSAAAKVDGQLAAHKERLRRLQDDANANASSAATATDTAAELEVTHARLVDALEALASADADKARLQRLVAQLEASLESRRRSLVLPPQTPTAAAGGTAPAAADPDVAHALQQELQQTREQLATAQSELAVASAAIGRAGGDGAGDVARTLREENARLRGKLTSAESMQHLPLVSQDRVPELASRIAQLEQQVQAAQAESAAQSARAASLQHQNASLLQALTQAGRSVDGSVIGSAADASVNSGDRDHERSRSRERALKRDVAQLTTQVERLSEEHSQAAETIAQLLAEKQQLLQQYTAMLEAAPDADVSKDGMRVDVWTLQAEKDAIAKELDMVRHELTTMRSERDLVAQQLDAFVDHTETFEAEQQVQSQQLAGLWDLMPRVRARLDDLGKENSMLHDAVAEHEARLEQARQRAQHVLDSVEHEHRQQMQAADDALQQERERVVRLQRRVRDLSSQVAQLEQAQGDAGQLLAQYKGMMREMQRSVTQVSLPTLPITAAAAAVGRSQPQQHSSSDSSDDDDLDDALRATQRQGRRSERQRARRGARDVEYDQDEDDASDSDMDLGDGVAAEMERINSKAALTQQQVKRLASERDRALAQAQRLGQELMATQVVLNTTSEVLEATSAKCEAIATERAALVTQLERTRGDFAAARTDIATLTERVNDATSAVHEADARGKSLAAELEQQAVALQQARATAEQAETLARDRLSLLSAEQSRAADAAAEAARAADDVARMRAQIKEQEAAATRAASLARELADARQDLDATAADVADLVTARDALADAVHSLQQQLAAASAERDHAVTEHDGLLQQVSTLTSQLRESQAARTQLLEQVQAHDATSAAKQAAYAVMSESTGRWHAEIDAAQAQVRKLQRERAEVLQRADDASRECARARVQVAALEKTTRRLEAETSQLRVDWVATIDTLSFCRQRLASVVPTVHWPDAETEADGNVAADESFVDGDVDAASVQRSISAAVAETVRHISTQSNVLEAAEARVAALLQQNASESHRSTMHSIESGAVHGRVLKLLQRLDETTEQVNAEAAQSAALQRRVSELEVALAEAQVAQQSAEMRARQCDAEAERLQTQQDATQQQLEQVSGQLGRGDRVAVRSSATATTSQMHCDVAVQCTDALDDLAAARQRIAVVTAERDAAARSVISLRDRVVKLQRAAAATDEAAARHARSSSACASGVQTDAVLIGSDGIEHDLRPALAQAEAGVAELRRVLADKETQLADALAALQRTSSEAARATTELEQTRAALDAAVAECRTRQAHETKLLAAVADAEAVIEQLQGAAADASKQVTQRSRDVAVLQAARDGSVVLLDRLADQAQDADALRATCHELFSLLSHTSSALETTTKEAEAMAVRVRSLEAAIQQEVPRQS